MRQLLSTGAGARRLVLVLAPPLTHWVSRALTGAGCRPHPEAGVTLPASPGGWELNAGTCVKQTRSSTERQSVPANASLSCAQLPCPSGAPRDTEPSTSQGWCPSEWGRAAEEGRVELVEGPVRAMLHGDRFGLPLFRLFEPNEPSAQMRWQTQKQTPSYARAVPVLPGAPCQAG